MLTAMKILAEVTPPAGPDFSSLVSTITGAISTGNILAIIGLCFTASMGFVLVWLGARKIGNSLMSAIRHGNLKV